MQIIEGHLLFSGGQMQMMGGYLLFNGGQMQFIEGHLYFNRGQMQMMGGYLLFNGGQMQMMGGSLHFNRGRWQKSGGESETLKGILPISCQIHRGKQGYAHKGKGNWPKPCTLSPLFCFLSISRKSVP